MFSGEVFEFDKRTRGANTMPVRLYLAVVTIFVAGGLLAGTFVGSLTYGMQPNWLWIVGYFLVAIPGVIISAKSDNWVVSSVGYAMVILATGAITGPYVALYKIHSVINIAVITVGVSIGIGVAGVIYPKSVEHWGGFLLTALWVLIFGSIAQSILLAFGFQSVGLQFWDWLGALLFCGFIFYDMNRAVRLAHTMDNAVDSAVALYLDIGNLLIRLLGAAGEEN